MKSFEFRLLHSHRPATISLILAVIAGTIAAALFIAQAIIISEIVNQVFLLAQTLAAVVPLLLTAVLLLLLRSGLIWVQEVWAQRSAGHLKLAWRQALLQKINQLGPAYTERESSGDLVHTLAEGIETFDEVFTRYVPSKILAVIVPAMVFIMVLILDPWTTLVFMFAGPMLLLLLALIGGQTKEMQKKRFSEMRWMSAFFLDMLQGLPTLKIFGRSREQAENIQEISRQYGSTTMEVLRTAFQTSLVMEWSATAATALVALEVSLRLMNGSLPFNTALAVLLLTPEFFLPLRQYALNYHAGQQGKAAADHLFTIMNLPEAQENVGTIYRAGNGARTGITITGPIHFENVSFSYEGESRLALKNFSMTMPEGQTTALVGSTGAGKSTVARLLLRFIQTQEGLIKVKDNSLYEVSSSEWRQTIAWVPQLPYLFDGTISQNIALARPDALADEIAAAAKAAQAHEFILSLPQGYDTPIGEKGLRLSGGQRQRLAIARAFLKDAPILILDEITANLDKENQARLQEAVARLMSGRTVLRIAHHLDSVIHAQQILLMSKGRVLAGGTHDDLLLSSESYRQLFQHFSGEPA